MANYDQEFYQSNYSQPQQQPWGQTQYTNPQSGQPLNLYSQGYSSEPVAMEVDGGSMGQIRETYQPAGDGGTYTGFEEEPPLLEELGIDFSIIKENTLSVLNPLKRADANALRNTDLAGPFLFCLLFGLSLLMVGKVHFGYIYGVGLLGCVGKYALLNLMSAEGVPILCVVSVLGYCLLPMVLLSATSIVISLQGVVGTLLTTLTIAWCSYSASKLFAAALLMHDQQLLVAYPCALMYGVFALLTVF